MESSYNSYNFGNMNKIPKNVEKLVVSVDEKWKILTKITQQSKTATVVIVDQCDELSQCFMFKAALVDEKVVTQRLLNTFCWLNCFFVDWSFWIGYNLYNNNCGRKDKLLLHYDTDIEN